MSEQELARLLQSTWPDAARDIEQVRGTDNGRDFVGTSPFCIQSKRRAKVVPFDIRTGLNEAAMSTDSEYPFPVVAWRSDREPWRVTMRLSTMIGFTVMTEGRERLPWDSLENPLITMELTDWLEFVDWRLARQRTAA
jgi:hypothetical protein